MRIFSFPRHGRWRWLLMLAFFCLFIAASNIIGFYASVIFKNTGIRSGENDAFTEIGFHQEPAFNPRKSKNHSRHSDFQVHVRNTSTIIVATSRLTEKRHDIYSHRKHKDLIPNDPNLAVLRLWQNYKFQHSKKRLQEEWDYHKRTNTTTNRTFAIGFYSCPLQAGNRLHHFFNTVIWAVVTNRTILWKYYDKETCQIFGRQYNPNICKAANTEKDCRKILERAPWIPSFDQWWSRFDLKRPELMSLWSFHEKLPKHKRWNDGDEKYQGLADTTKSQTVAIAQMLGQDFKDMKSKRKRNKVLLTEQARKRAKSLLSNGVDFLYGLVFRETLAFRKDVFPAFEVQVQTHSAPVTFALHSRHSKTSDDGSNVKREIECLEEVLKNHSNDESCLVYLLSDRPATLAALTDYLLGRNDSCQGVVTSHTVGKSFTDEHGPFAGIGYFEDLHLASQARHGFVGHSRSSSDLVRELMEYDRQMAAIQTDHWPLQELQTCKLP